MVSQDLQKNCKTPSSLYNGNTIPVSFSHKKETVEDTVTVCPWLYERGNTMVSCGACITLLEV